MFNLFNKKNNNNLNFDSLLKIDNHNLNKILKYVSDKPILFEENLRLISKREIENFENEYKCKVDGLIPLIDVSDNDFIVYICDKKTFGMYNIVDELLFNEDYDVTEIIKKLDSTKRTIKVNENLEILFKYDSAWFGKLDYDFGNIKSKTLDIQIDAYDINESLERAKKILKDFFENWSIIKTEIIEKIYEYYNEKRKQLGYDIELNEFYPNVNDKYEITNMIEIIGITIPSDVYECGIVCNCTWEEEHGLGIRLVNNKVVEIGEQGIAL